MRLNDILAHHTGQTVEKIALDTERDNFMSATEAVRTGWSIRCSTSASANSDTSDAVEFPAEGPLRAPIASRLAVLDKSRINNGFRKRGPWVCAEQP